MKKRNFTKLGLICSVFLIVLSNTILGQIHTKDLEKESFNMGQIGVNSSSKSPVITETERACSNMKFTYSYQRGPKGWGGYYAAKDVGMYLMRSGDVHLEFDFPVYGLEIEFSHLNDRRNDKFTNFSSKPDHIDLHETHTWDGSTLSGYDHSSRATSVLKWDGPIESLNWEQSKDTPSYGTVGVKRISYNCCNDQDGDGICDTDENDCNISVSVTNTATLKNSNRSFSNYTPSMPNGKSFVFDTNNEYVIYEFNQKVKDVVFAFNNIDIRRFYFTDENDNPIQIENLASNSQTKIGSNTIEDLNKVWNGWDTTFKSNQTGKSANGIVILKGEYSKIKIRGESVLGSQTQDEGVHFSIKYDDSCGIDTDGDGINDEDDLDDDNDGILDEDECSNNIVTEEFDGTFGSSNKSVCRDLQTAVSGVGYRFNCTSDEGVYAVINGRNDSHHPHFNDMVGHTTGTLDDNFLAVNGNTNVGIFYQKELNLKTDTDYNFSTWVANVAPNGNRYPAEVGIRIKDNNGNTVANYTTGRITDSKTWKETSGIFNTGSKTKYKIEIYNITRAAAGNDFAIDDISISEVGSQGCVDTDGDGIIDSLDTDSDGDGCPDAIEGSGSFSSNDLDSDQSLSGPVDENGVPIVADGGQGIGTSKDASQNNCESSCTDTDGDGICDSVDECPEEVGTIDNNGCPDECDQSADFTAYNDQSPQTIPIGGGESIDFSFDTDNQGSITTETIDGTDVIQFNIDSSNPKKVTYKFSKPVKNFRTCIYDIDKSKLGVERIQLIAKKGNVEYTISPSEISLGSAIKDLGNQTYRGEKATSKFEINDNQKLCVNITGPIDEFTILCSETYDTDRNFGFSNPVFSLEDCNSSCDSDSDGDGICDDEDNCPTTANADQLDTDGDGIGDACDECPEVAGISENKGCPACEDSDGDGVCDDVDSCPDEPGVAENYGCPACYDALDLEAYNGESPQTIDLINGESLIFEFNEDGTGDTVNPEVVNGVESVIYNINSSSEKDVSYKFSSSVENFRTCVYDIDYSSDNRLEKIRFIAKNGGKVYNLSPSEVQLGSSIENLGNNTYTGKEITSGFDTNDRQKVCVNVKGPIDEFTIANSETYAGRRNFGFANPVFSFESCDTSSSRVKTGEVNEGTVEKTALFVYPNPTDGKIKTKSDKLVKYWKVVDLSGNVVLKSESLKNTKNYEVDLHQLRSDVYIYQVVFEDGTSQTKRIVKK